MNRLHRFTLALAGMVVFAGHGLAQTQYRFEVFGAAGYSCDLPIERMVRDARMFTIGGGTAQVQRNLIGKEVLDRARAGLAHEDDSVANQAAAD